MDINEIITKKGETEAAVWDLLKTFQAETSTEIDSVDVKQARRADGRSAIVSVSLDVRLPKFPIPGERQGDTHTEDELGPITNL